jgi:uncharacterized protein YjaG (DUF416 family)
MSDIVDRLLKEGALEGSYDVPAIQRQAAEEIKLLRQVCARLARDLSTAQTDILPWIEKVQHLTAANMEQAAALRQQDGKVTVSRDLVESVLEDAEAWVTSEYVINGEIHRSERRRYLRDIEDIWKLKAELRAIDGE